MKLLTFALGFLVSASLWAGPGDHYDEVYQPDGTPRAHYREALQIYNKMSPQSREKFGKHSKQFFKGDNSLSPIPRILTVSEFNHLKEGVQQRAEALSLFLQDFYSGEHEYAKYDVIPETVVQQIIERTKERGFYGELKPSQIAFIYGPDIVRTADGTFRVIEDNPGYVGGFGDLKIARDALFQLAPQYQTKLIPATHPDTFYSQLVESYKRRAQPQTGKIILYQQPPYPDNEDERISKIFENYGIETITQKSNSKIMTDPDGHVVIKRPGDPPVYERVGFVIFNGEHRQYDLSHPATRRAFLLDGAENLLEDKHLDGATRKALNAVFEKDPYGAHTDPDLLAQIIDNAKYKIGYHSALRNSPNGLVDAILHGRVGSNYSPGVDFVGDKEFYTYIEDMIRFYLFSEPILKNLPTDRFYRYDAQGAICLDTDLMQKIFSSETALAGYVIKKVDGRGGDSVWIGSKIKPAEIQKLKAKITAHPEQFIAQKYVPLSEVDSMIVDLRLLSDVSAEGTIVSSVPWGRGLPAKGDGKVNLSAHGKEFTVLVVPDEPSCLVKGFREYNQSLESH